MFRTNNQLGLFSFANDLSQKQCDTLEDSKKVVLPPGTKEYQRVGF